VTEPDAAGADVDDQFVAVGRIGPAHGVRGEVFVEPWTDELDERFADGATFTTDPPERGPLTIASTRMNNRRLMVQFEGIDDRDQARAVHHTHLLIPASSRPPLDDPDDFYDSDLVGLAARTVAGVALGPVTDVVHTGTADYLVLNLEGREHLVPFVSAIVPSVDLRAGVVVIDPPDNLFEMQKG
jgi:16S rRNA processing protein RimM